MQAGRQAGRRKPDRRQSDMHDIVRRAGKIMPLLSASIIQLPTAHDFVQAFI